MIRQFEQLLPLGVFDKWRTGLIFEPNRHYRSEQSIAEADKAETRERQTQLNEAAQTGPEMLSRFMFTGMRIDPGDAVKQTPGIPILTASEISTPTLHAETEFASALTKAKVTRSIAANPRFWAISHACWIRMGRFDGDQHQIFLRGRGDKTLEGKARNFIRRIGALPARVHGHHTTIMDSPLSTMWWRVELATEAAQHCDGQYSFDEAHRLLLGKSLWRRLVQVCASHAPSLNAPRARAAIIQAFINWDGKLTQTHVDAACRRVAQVALTRSLYLVPWGLMVDEAESGLCAVDEAKAEKAEEG